MDTRKNPETEWLVIDEASLRLGEAEEREAERWLREADSGRMVTSDAPRLMREALTRIATLEAALQEAKQPCWPHCPHCGDDGSAEG